MADIFYLLKKGLTILIMLAVLPLAFIQAQVTVENYPGIPLIIYNGLRPDSMKAIHYEWMDSMGVFGVLSTDVQYGSTGNGRLELYEEHGLKVLPYQVWANPNNIFKYTDSHYSVWEAEGTTYEDTTNGKATLYRSNNTTIVTEGETVSVKTGNGVTSGEALIYGPGYTQDAKYRFGTAIGDTIVNYYLEYYMKIVRTGNLPPGYLQDTVCTILVTNIADDDTAAMEETVQIKGVTVSEFNGWDNWEVIDTLYDLVNFQSSPHFGDGMNQIDSDWQPAAHYVQFKVIWKGLDYLDLYIDKITVYDVNGNRIVNNLLNTQSLIAQQVSEQLSDTTVMGWYALDEPVTIDNYEPIRVVAGIIDSVSGGNVKLWAGISRTWNGYYGLHLGGSHSLFPPLEFSLRTKLENVHLNTYMYNSPWNGIIGDPAYKPNWKGLNINLIANLHLNKINDFNTSIAYSTQAGGFNRLNDECDLVEGVVPTQSQINYHVNLGLLHGVKELWLDPFFSKVSYSNSCGTPFYSTNGLIDANDDTTANYNFFRFTLVPRLNGLFGKTLKNSQQTYQQTEFDALDPSSIVSPSKFSSIEANVEQQSPDNSAYVDFGFFDDNTDAEKDYFMLVNRYYNNQENFTVSLDDLTGGYDNWSVKNYIDTISTTVNQNSSSQASFDVTIDVGDAKLYSVLPVVKYGGELTINDTVNSSVILFDDMTIGDSVELIIEEDYAISATVTLEGTGFITGDGYIYFNSYGEIIVNRWNKALFKSKINNHPMLIWGEYPSDTITVTGYKIYRKIGGSDWQWLNTVADTIFTYVDQTLTISYSGEGAVYLVQYKVTATYGVSSETSETNIITEAVNNQKMGKKANGSESPILEYNLAQNYPNPFNPSTTISYSIKYDNHVSLKIYDILGNEVLVLVDKNETAGKYTVEFDASTLSSGVYIYQLKSGDFIDVKKMILLK